MIVVGKDGLQRQAWWSPLYDLATVAASASTGTSITFFASRTRNANGRQVTNMTKAGELPAPERFTAHALRVITTNVGLTDMQELFSKFALYMEVSGKVVLEGTLEGYPAGGGVYGFAATTATTTTLAGYNNGIPDSRASVMFPEKYAIPIESGEPFKVVLEGTAFTATAAIILKVMLEGVHEWPIN